jgi:hypothetical protein
MAVTGKSSTQKLFERNLLWFSINSETPKFWDVEALLDSLAVRRLVFLSLLLALFSMYHNHFSFFFLQFSLKILCLSMVVFIQRLVMVDAASMEDYEFMLVRFARYGKLDLVSYCRRIFMVWGGEMIQTHKAFQHFPRRQWEERRLQRRDSRKRPLN